MCPPEVVCRLLTAPCLPVAPRERGPTPGARYVTSRGARRAAKVGPGGGGGEHIALVRSAAGPLGTALVWRGSDATVWESDGSDRGRRSAVARAVCGGTDTSAAAAPAPARGGRRQWREGRWIPTARRRESVETLHSPEPPGRRWWRAVSPAHQTQVER